MKTLKELYRIGKGPSSSHTLGPEYAVKTITNKYPDADRFKAVLFGSLAMTGKGHGTDRIIREVINKPVEILFEKHFSDITHPNTMDIYVYTKNNLIIKHRIISTGGGAVIIEGIENPSTTDKYTLNTYNQIKDYCLKNEMRLYDYVIQCEDKDILNYFYIIWQTMKDSIKQGLKAEGLLPGGLNIQRKAKYLYNQNHIDESPETKENRMVCSYAFAAAEQNADCGTVVTAPTCGACGVLPSVMYYMQKKHNFSDEKIIKALMTAGLIGNLVKKNASISGAECGCQAEIGTACSMAAAGLAELFNMDLEQIEYAAEIAMEHHLGLTCDPVKGLVQVPCIERNAVAAMRAINALSLASFLTYSRKISFDLIIKTMYETGKDISKYYKETGKAGLAKLYKKELK